MTKLLFAFGMAAVCAFGQYKTESAGAPPNEVAAEIREALQKDGIKVVGPSGAYCELWFRTSLPSGSNTEQNASFSNIPAGAVLGAIRFPSAAKDRRGQTIKPGVYTLRLSFFPVDGAHQGIAPTRDFLLLSPAADDTDPKPIASFHALVALSAKTTGLKHPAILNVWKPDSAAATEVKQEGEDWVLYTKIGDTPVALIVVGTYQG